jgi:hypothetical protein
LVVNSVSFQLASVDEPVATDLRGSQPAAMDLRAQSRPPDSQEGGRLDQGEQLDGRSVFF